MTGLPDRPEPGALLARIRKEEPPHGKLHIFLGMCPGVGKTYAMLQTAHQRMEEGTEALAGLVETHGRPKRRCSSRPSPIPSSTPPTKSS
jgi:two-component system sensor histidine kinase KdpD